MPGNLFTPVTIRRRSAAQGCADAHPDRRPVSDHQRAVGSVKPRSVTDVILGLAGIDELIKWVKTTL